MSFTGSLKIKIVIIREKTSGIRCRFNPADFFEFTRVDVNGSLVDHPLSLVSRARFSTKEIRSGHMQGMITLKHIWILLFFSFCILTD